MTSTQEDLAPIYFATAEAPTWPSSVSPSTHLEELNLNWRERDLPERERTKHVHRLHPYLGKFIPQLVEIFLRKYFIPGDVVLDPFCGSGTTLVQANELGIAGVGFDVSAFNVMLSRAKTKEYAISNLKGEVLDILHRVAAKTQSQALLPTFCSPPLSEATDQSPSSYLTDWFAPKALDELIAYRDLIPEYGDRELLSVILSRAARSARLTTHFDLDFPKSPQKAPYWCYKHSRTCAPTDSAYQFLKRYSHDTLDRIQEYAYLRTNATVSILHGDAREAPIPPISGVITSPPYVGLIDYHEQHRYAYELLGLEDCSSSEIGPASSGTSKKARSNYQRAIADVFLNAIRAMSSGGRLVVVAGDRHELYPGIAELCDVEVEAILKRHVNRRTGRRSNEFFESVFVWRKR